MIHVISIKKNQFKFFIVSIIISIIVTFTFHLNGPEKISEDDIKCSKYIYVKPDNAYKTSVLFNYIQIIFKEELNKLINNPNLEAEDNNIYFKIKNCDDLLLSTLEKLNKIEEIIKTKLYLLSDKIDEAKSKLPINDQVLLFDIEKIKFLSVQEKQLFTNNKIITKRFIQFLIILILLNTLYFLKSRIKFILK